MEIFTRFTNIVNDLKSLGKFYTNSELIRKILRSPLKAQEAKVTAIQEAKDPNKLPLEELFGSLMTHELTMRQNVEEEIKKKKTIALKTTTSKNDESDESDEKDEEKDLALITK